MAGAALVSDSRESGVTLPEDPRLEAEVLCERGVEHCLGGLPIVLELGFGRAELILSLAREHPGQSFLGVEVSRKRVTKAARRIQRGKLRNVHIVHSSAEYVVERVLPAGCVGECWINCPDPWPKKRHFRRRLIKPDFVRALAGVLVPEGLVHVSTDHAGYAEWIAEVLAVQPALENLHAPEPWSGTRPDRAETAYEAEWREEGRTLRYFDYRKCR